MMPFVGLLGILLFALVGTLIVGRVAKRGKR